jgi:short-subunit dehydrogenase
MAERGDQVFLLGRDLDELGRSARDLEARGAPAPVGTAACDLLDPSGHAAALDAAEAALGQIDTFVITAAIFATQEKLEADPVLRDQMLTANFVGTIQLSELVRERLLARGGGTLCVFSSVAGERARKPIVLYGATKAGLTAYLNGLDARFHDRGLRVVLVKPGFVKTTMTAGLDPPPFAGDPDAVAASVLSAIDARRAEIYVPWPWRFVMMVIRMLPRAVMRKVRF